MKPALPIAPIGAATLLVVCLALGGLPVANAANEKSERFRTAALAQFDKGNHAAAAIEARNAIQADRSNVAARVLLGRAMLNLGEVSDSETTLTEAMAAGANRAEVVVPLAQAMAAQGKLNLVLKSSAFALDGLPPDTQSKLLLVQAAAQADLGDIDQALKVVAQARGLAPNSPETWFSEIPFRVRKGQYAEAKEAVARATALSPDSATAFYFRGSIFHLEGKLTDALELYGKAIEKDSKHAPSLLARAGLWVDLNKLPDAARDLKALLAVDPGNPMAIYLRALVAEREGKSQEAAEQLRSLTELLDQIPIDFIRYRPQALMLMGLAHYGLRQNEKARQYFEIFVKSQPDAPIAKPLAQIHLQSRGFDQAIAVLEPFVKANPQDGQALAMLGSAYMAKGQNAQATALMERALASRDDPRLRTVLGIGLQGLGRTDAAIKEFEAILKKDPSQWAAGTVLINHYGRIGDTRKALALAESLFKQHPRQAGLANLLGMARANARDLAGARQAFVQAQAIDPSFAAPKLNLARLELSLGNVAAADKSLRSLLQTEPKNSDAMHELARLAARQGRPGEAVQLLEQANAQAGPRDFRHAVALADLQLRLGNQSASLAAAKAASAKSSSELPVLLALARAQIALGDATSAKSNLVAATASAGSGLEAQLMIARLQMQLGNYGGATYSLDKASIGNPDQLEVLAARGELELRQKAPDKARVFAQRLLSRYPKSALGHSLLGDISLSQNQVPAALDSYLRSHAVAPSTESFLKAFQLMSATDRDKAARDWAATWLRLRAGDVVARSAYADHLARQKDWEQARQQYEEVLKTQPGNPGVLNNLANVLLQQKNPQALGVAQRAVQSNPLNPALLDTLGQAQLAAGTVDQAIATLREAVKQGPNMAEIRLHLAQALGRSGQLAEARTELQAAIRLQPSLAQRKEVTDLSGPK